MDYKKYSLENLENWLHDAMSAGEATPQEIYDAIKSVVEENYYIYKEQTSKAYELLALLNGNGRGNIKAFDDCVDKILSCDRNDPSPECKGAWNDFWEDADSSREYNLREAEYYNRRAEIDAKVEKKWKPVSVDGPPVYVSEDGDVFVHDYYATKKNEVDKVVKWQLPVQVDGLTGDCFVEFPDDLLEAASLKEGDKVEWVDRGDGSYLLRKVNEHS